MEIFSTTDNDGKCIFFNDDDLNHAAINIEHITKEDIKTLINDYDNERLFSDEMLKILLKDNILKEYEKIKEEQKKKELEKKRAEVDYFINSIEKVIYSNNRTIVFWHDGTKTVVKCDKDDDYDREKGLALCIIKHLFGDIGYYNEIFKAFELNSYNANKDIMEFKKTKKALSKGRKAWFKKAFLKNDN